MIRPAIFGLQRRSMQLAGQITAWVFGPSLATGTRYHFAERDPYQSRKALNE